MNPVEYFYLVSENYIGTEKIYNFRVYYESEKGFMSYFGFVLVARSANISPTSGAILNP